MSNKFRVRLLSFSNLLEIEGARTADSFAGLLDAMDYGDASGMSDDEMREMCLMSLQDLDPVEAAYVVLKHDMADVLRDGQARNLAGEMLDEKLWEEYADSRLHERFFTSGSLLYSAFPRDFPKPDAVHAQIEVTAENTDAREQLASPLHESFLVRLLADGMDSNAILHRLYGKELTGTSFPNADEVVWIVRTEVISEQAMNIGVISSGYWLDALEDTEVYESNAYADEIRTPPRKGEV